jgi:hypothetical protein
MSTIVFLVVVAAVLIWLVATYNGLITDGNRLMCS